MVSRHYCLPESPESRQRYLQTPSHHYAAHTPQTADRWPRHRTQARFSNVEVATFYLSLSLSMALLTMRCSMASPFCIPNACIRFFTRSDAKSASGCLQGQKNRLEPGSPVDRIDPGAGCLSAGIHGALGTNNMQATGLDHSLMPLLPVSFDGLCFVGSRFRQRLDFCLPVAP